jgi:hypothetical protein
VRRIVFLVMFCVLAGAVSARAENRKVEFRGIGPRVGLSINPDQFVFGGQVDFGDPFPHTNLLLPVVEIGVGDHETVTSIGSDLLFRFVDRWGVWTPYVGGELDFLIVTFDTPGGGDKTDTNLALMGVFGVEKGIGADNRFGVELKFQLVDSPDLKLAAHWTFGH